MEKSTIKKFIEILPVKYFFFEIQDEEIVNVYFYFKLAKICFLEIILKRIIENLKNNSIENFDQICKVDSIWDIKYVHELDKNSVNNNNIFKLYFISHFFFTSKIKNLKMNE